MLRKQTELQERSLEVPLVIMIALESEIQKLMASYSLSIHHTSFLWTLLQKLVRYTPTVSWLVGAGVPFLEITLVSLRLPETLW